MEIVNLREKCSRIHDYWNPRTAGRLNDLGPGELIIVSRGGEHCPLAGELPPGRSGRRGGAATA